MDTAGRGHALSEANKASFGVPYLPPAVLAFALFLAHDKAPYRNLLFSTSRPRRVFLIVIIAPCRRNSIPYAVEIFDPNFCR